MSTMPTMVMAGQPENHNQVLVSRTSMDSPMISYQQSSNPVMLNQHQPNHNQYPYNQYQITQPSSTHTNNYNTALGYSRNQRYQSAANRPLCRCRVIYLGSSVPHKTKNGLHGIQDPLKNLYPEERFQYKQQQDVSSCLGADQMDSATQISNSNKPQYNTIDISHLSSDLGIDSWLSVWSNGILLENVDEFGREIKRFFHIGSLHYCAAVRFFDTRTLETSQAPNQPQPRSVINRIQAQVKNKKQDTHKEDTTSSQLDQNNNNESNQNDNHNSYRKSFDSMDGAHQENPDKPIGASGDELQCSRSKVTATTQSKSTIKFLPLDAPLFQCPGMLDTKHPPVFSAILRRTSGIKVLECHSFICRRDAAANALVRCCTHAYADLVSTRQRQAMGLPPHSSIEQAAYLGPIQSINSSSHYHNSSTTLMNPLATMNSFTNSESTRWRSRSNRSQAGAETKQRDSSISRQRTRKSNQVNQAKVTAPNLDNDDDEDTHYALISRATSQQSKSRKGSSRSLFRDFQPDSCVDSRPEGDQFENDVNQHHKHSHSEELLNETMRFNDNNDNVSSRRQQEKFRRRRHSRSMQDLVAYNNNNTIKSLRQQKVPPDERPSEPSGRRRDSRRRKNNNKQVASHLRGSSSCYNILLDQEENRNPVNQSQCATQNEYEELKTTTDNKRLIEVSSSKSLRLNHNSDSAMHRNMLLLHQSGSQTMENMPSGGPSRSRSTAHLFASNPDPHHTSLHSSGLQSAGAIGYPTNAHEQAAAVALAANHRLATHYHAQQQYHQPQLVVPHLAGHPFAQATAYPATQTAPHFLPPMAAPFYDTPTTSNNTVCQSYYPNSTMQLYNKHHPSAFPLLAPFPHQHQQPSGATFVGAPPTAPFFMNLSNLPPQQALMLKPGSSATMSSRRRSRGQVMSLASETSRAPTDEHRALEITARFRCLSPPMAILGNRMPALHYQQHQHHQQHHPLVHQPPLPPLPTTRAPESARHSRSSSRPGSSSSRPTSRQLSLAATRERHSIGSSSVSIVGLDEPIITEPPPFINNNNINININNSKQQASSPATTRNSLPAPSRSEQPEAFALDKAANSKSHHQSAAAKTPTKSQPSCRLSWFKRLSLTLSSSSNHETSEAAAKRTISHDPRVSSQDNNRSSSVSNTKAHPTIPSSMAPSSHEDSDAIKSKSNTKKQPTPNGNCKDKSSKQTKQSNSKRHGGLLFAAATLTLGRSTKSKADRAPKAASSACAANGTAAGAQDESLSKGHPADSNSQNQVTPAQLPLQPTLDQDDQSPQETGVHISGLVHRDAAAPVLSREAVASSGVTDQPNKGEQQRQPTSCSKLSIGSRMDELPGQSDHLVVRAGEDTLDGLIV